MSDFDRKLRKKPMSSYSIAEPIGDPKVSSGHMTVPARTDSLFPLLL